MFLSIVIPAYNEEGRIGRTLSSIYDHMRTKDFDFEVIAVDDGSTDRTVDKMLESSLARDGKLKVLKNGENRGKGFSVKNGILGSSGRYVLFTDADLSTPITEMDKLFSQLHKGFDIVIGSRGAEDSYVKVHQPWYREYMGKVFNLFVRTLLIGDFHDTQCGFKLFSGPVARKIAGELRMDGFCFDVEILYLAKRKGYKIKETGVVWQNSPQSKVKLFDSSFNMFFDLFRIKRLH